MIRLPHPLFILAYLGALLVVIVLSLIPPPDISAPEGSDKAAHLIAYGVIAFCGGLGFRNWDTRILAATSAVGIGVALEVAQVTLFERNGSVWDAIANAGASRCFDYSVRPLETVTGYESQNRQTLVGTNAVLPVLGNHLSIPGRHDDTTIEFTVNPVPGKASTILEKEGPFSVRNAAAKRTGIAISAWIPGRTRNDDAAVEQITFKLPIGLPVQKPADRSQTMCGAVRTFPRPGDALTGFGVRVVDSASAEPVDDERIGSYGTGC